MQSRTNTLNPTLSSILSKKIFLLAFIFMGFISISQEAKAQSQLTVEVIDILMFSNSSFQSTTPSLSQNDPINVQISPNPASSHLTIQKSANTEIKRLDIVDMQGNVKYSGTLGGLSTYISIGTGLYNFRIITDKGVVTKIVSII